MADVHKHSLLKLSLAIGDYAVLVAALWIGLIVRYGTSVSPDVFSLHIKSFTWLFLIWIAIFYIQELYEPRMLTNNLRFFRALGSSVLINALLTALLLYIVPGTAISPRRNLVIIAAIGAIFIWIWRRTVNNWLGAGAWRTTIEFLGTHELIDQLKRDLSKNKNLGYRVVSERGATLVLAPNFYRSDEHVLDLTRSLDTTPNIMTVQEFYEELYKKMPLRIAEPHTLITELVGSRRAYEIIKRLLDIVFALIAAALFLIVLPFAALAIKLEDNGPVFYRQVRLGRHGKRFEIIKFRSMVMDAESRGPQWTTDEDTRVTRTGRVLRRAFFDELPQCLNIIAGNMSVVGPRPERPEFIEGTLARRIPFYELRHVARPGVTGWAQVNYPYARSVEDTLHKTEYDLYYIKNRSLLLDLAIILKTLGTIFKGNR